MRVIREFIKQHTLLLGFVTVVFPLVVLLALQFQWLVELRHKSEEANQSSLETHLDFIDEKIRGFYEKQADLLDMPAEWFYNGREERISREFEHQRDALRGVRALFVAFYASTSFSTANPMGTILIDGLDGLGLRNTPAFDSQMVSAVRATVIDYTMLYHQDLPAIPGLYVKERDPAHRIIYRPILSSKGFVYGVAGLVVDAEYFQTTLLPRAINKVLQVESGEFEVRYALALRNRDGGIARTIGVYDPSQHDDAAIHFGWIFKDLQLGLQVKGLTPVEAASANFRFNATALGVVALVLLLGVMVILRTASREMRLSAMKSDFVSNVSHELRTPLASIRVFGEFLRLRRVEDPRQIQEYGEYIEAESRRLTQLINNILDFAQIDSGRKSYSMKPCRIEDVVDATLKTMSLRLEHKGFELAYERPQAAIPKVRIDPEALTQALHNLIDNAVKYSDDQKRIEVKLEKAGSFALISVRDRGRGISKAEQKRIFERFHRVGTGAVHDVKGSGLGLSIVSHVVAAHGGKIRVDSVPGEGSTFSIVLPLSSADTGGQDGSEAEATE